LTSLPAPDTQRAASPEKIEIVLRIVDSLSARKIDEALQYVADDFELDLSSSIGPLRGIYRGRQAAYELWTSLLNAWTTVHFDSVDAIEVCDSRVILINRVQVAVPAPSRMTFTLSCGPSAATKRNGSSSTGRSPRPSKPPGCGSRRCRRRT